MQLDKNLFYTYLRVMHHYPKHENLVDAKAPEYYNIVLGQLADFVLKSNPKADLIFSGGTNQMVNLVFEKNIKNCLSQT
jgi:hypothetical protein